MTKKTTTEIKEIVRVGASISISADRTTTELKEIIRISANSGSTITIREAHSKTTSELKELARIGKNKVIFEL